MVFRMVFRILTHIALSIVMIAAPLWSSAAQETPQDASSPARHDLATTLHELDSTWNGISRQLSSHKLSAASIEVLHPQLLELETLREKAGIRALEGSSLALLSAAARLEQAGDIDSASYLFGKALRLSPSSPRVKFNALSLSGQLGVESPILLLKDAIFSISSDPGFLVTVIAHMIHPICWSLTISLYLVFVVFAFFWLVEIMRSVAYLFPPNIRGWAAPIVTLLGLVVPIALGPLPCLVVWGCLLWQLDLRRKWPCMLVGIVVCAWGSASPIRERTVRWLSEPGAQILLSYTSGNVVGNEKYNLQKLVLTTKNDPVAWFSYGQILRRYGEYEKALVALTNAVNLKPNAPWILAERGALYAVMGDGALARKDMAAAKAMGFKSAAFFFNYSKVAFDELDTAYVRQYLNIASAINAAETKTLIAREWLLGEANPASFADVTIPLRAVVGAMWSPQFAPTSYKASALFFGLPPIVMVAVGGGIFFLPLLFAPTKLRRRLSPYYAEYEPSHLVLACTRLLPGGPWIIAGRCRAAFLSLSCVIFLVLPFMGWPAESRWLTDFYPAWIPSYGAILAIVTLSVIVAALVTTEE